ncbi:MAG: YcgN family cysteine cluster protein [Defluviicoccus sp.]
MSTGPAEQPVPFWKRLKLEEMSTGEWESLCDGCGKCCLEKIEDSETGLIEFTDVACRLLDIGTCRCRHYNQRRRYVRNCEQLTPESVRAFTWLPSTCAYRLLAQGRDLPWWHPLVSGDPELVHALGISARGRAVPPTRRQRLEHHIVTWPA